MSTENVNTFFSNLGSLPHQAEFAAKFLAVDSAQRHLLSSLPGLGKGFVGSAIVGYVATHMRAQQILVLVPTAVAQQHWVEMVRRTNLDAPCDFVDQRRLRELESRQNGTDSIWSQIGVVVMSLDFAKRPDVAKVLAQTKWDFLVVDDAHLLAPQTQRLNVITALVERSPEMRVLYLHRLSRTLSGEERDNLLFKDIETTVWSRDTVRDKEGGGAAS